MCRARKVTSQKRRVSRAIQRATSGSKLQCGPRHETDAITKQPVVRDNSFVRGWYVRRISVIIIFR